MLFSNVLLSPYWVVKYMNTSWMGLEPSQGGRSMTSLKVSIFLRSSIIWVKFPPQPFELSIIIPATTSFGILDTSGLLVCRNNSFLWSKILICQKYIALTI